MSKNIKDLVDDITSEIYSWIDIAGGSPQDQIIKNILIKMLEKYENTKLLENNKKDITKY